ncbi:MAG: NAD(P)-dependent oxidoreductase [Candidatus Micrarchaeota archaeon]|nr:NAD(P)-dependent oxidoreductase [Candidatus Micrarchaeota archaeon]
MPNNNKKNGPKTVNLVTGSTSSLGVHLVKELLKRGEVVRVIVQQHPSKNDEWHTLPAGVAMYVADLTFPTDRDRKSLREACKGVDRIFHLAAASFNYKFKYDEMININVIGTENMLKAYLDANPEPDARVHFIYSSSCTVYGYKRPGELLTEESEIKPASPYSETKVMAEKVIQAFSASSKKIFYTIIRLGVFYGEGYEREVVKVFRLIKEGKITYIGSGSNHLTFVDVDDAVQAILLSLDNVRSVNNVYNITDGRPYTQKSLFEMAAASLKVKMPSRGINPLVARIGAATKSINYDEFEFLISDRSISIDKAKKELGYKPAKTVEDEAKRITKKLTEGPGA